MKKVFALLFILLPGLCFAQVREQVCIVRPNYSESLIEDLKEFAPRLKKLGVDNPEEHIEKFITKGSSGSGFVYVAPDGKNYVITNRHVIADADTSTVIFQNEEGDESLLVSGLKIVAANADLDLAVLAFPDDKQPFKSSLPISEEKIHDGDTVFTAGYPGLLGNPSWQFGSGNITNAYAKVPEMINPEYSSVIQHAAQVDAGNSGGPLLRKNENNQYEIIGINAWKITNRENTNFSIPAKTILSFINNVLSGNEVTTRAPEEAILEQATQLQKILNKFNVTFEELIGFISIEFIQEEGKAIFDYVYSNCNYENRNTIKDILVNYSPIMSIRYAIGWYIFNKFHEHEKAWSIGQKSTVKEDKLPAIPTPVKYDDLDVWYTAFKNKATSKYAKTEWKYTNGAWELYSFQQLSRDKLDNKNSRMGKKKEKSEKNSTTLEFTDEVLRQIPEDKIFYDPNVLEIQTGILANAEKCKTFPTFIDLEVKLIDVLAFDITGVINESTKRIYYYGKENTNFESVEAFGGLQLQFPITKQAYKVMPYITIQGGVICSDLKSFAIQPLLRAEAGGRISYFFSRKISLNTFVDLNCQVKMDLKTFKPNIGCVASFGFAF